MGAANPSAPGAGSPRAVVFDVGNVLLKWDPRHLYRKVFADPHEMEWFLSTVCTNDWNAEQDRGRPWADAEAEAIARHPAYAEPIRAYRARWHEMVPGPIAGTVAVLEQLSAAGVPLYAITNFAGDTFREVRAQHAFFDHFRGIVVSGDQGMLKPEEAIYRKLAEAHGVDLQRAVFIDDSLPNVDGARAVGMAAIHFHSPEQLADALHSLGFGVQGFGVHLSSARP